MDFYGDRLLFIGVPHEYRDFSGEFGLVEYLPTQNFLEIAQAIAGSLLFIGNQSSPMAVCEGLKHPSIQETSLDPADCIYKRSNAQYCFDGTATLPGFGREDLKLHAAKLNPIGISTETTPPGMWQLPGCAPCVNFKGLVELAQRISPWKEKTKEEIEYAIKADAVARRPDFFDKGKTSFHLVKMALETAGY